MTQRDCFFTSIALNYLSKALALATSVFDIHPLSRFVISVLDHGTLPPPVLARLEEVRTQFAERGQDLRFMDPMPLFDNPLSFRFKYTIVEGCTSVKPAVALRLLEEFESVTYLDPDTILYTPLPEDPRLGETWDVQVTPHVLCPAHAGAPISERLFLYYGTFNLGYFAVRRSEQAIEFLHWWNRFCIDFGADAPQAGLFVDQKPVDLLPSFVDRVSVLRHPGCNVAWWNIFSDQRRLLPDARSVHFRGASHALVFYHFSNLDNSNAKHRLVARPLQEASDGGVTRRYIDEDPALAALYADYGLRVGAWQTLTTSIASELEATARPSPAGPLVRLLYGEARRRGMAESGDPSVEAPASIGLRSAKYIRGTLGRRDLALIYRAFRAFVRSPVSPSLLRHIS